MHGYRVVPVDPAFAAEVRRTGLAPGYGHPAHAELATGYGPCRICLDTFVAGEERRILVTYDPFAGREPYPLPSPIYIHEHACTAYAETARFPEALRFIPLTLNGYAHGRQVRIEGGHRPAVRRSAHRLYPRQEHRSRLLHRSPRPGAQPDAAMSGAASQSDQRSTSTVSTGSNAAPLPISSLTPRACWKRDTGVPSKRSGRRKTWQGAAPCSQRMWQPHPARARSGSASRPGILARMVPSG